MYWSGNRGFLGCHVAFWHETGIHAMQLLAIY
jgi:hypothetical protein